MQPTFGAIGQRMRQLQGDIVLPTARTIYLLIACVSLVAAIGALLLAILLHMQTWQAAPEVSVPDAAYQPSAQMDFSIVRSRLQPPGNVRAYSVVQTISGHLGGNEIVARFAADTPNGLASYPEDFSIVGGKNADLFQTTAVYDAGQAHTALRATVELANQLDAQGGGYSSTRAHAFHLNVVARDRFRNHSSVVPVTLTLYTGPQTVEQRVPAPAASEPQHGMTDLEKLAAALAAIVDPAKTVAYFDAYKRALREPGDCGASDGDEAFTGAYRASFNQERKLLRKENIEAFYAGVCEAWGGVLSRTAALREQAQAARDEALTKNAEAEVATQVKIGAARLGRNAAVSFALGAIALFVTISLFLAFMAIENHTKVVTDAIVLLTKDRAQQTPST